MLDWSNFLKQKTQKFHKTFMTINNHHLTVKMLTSTFAAYINVLKKCVGFYDTYSRNLAHGIHDQPMPNRYLTVISYHLQQTSAHCQLAFQHTHACFTNLFISFTKYTDKLLIQISIFWSMFSRFWCFYNIKTVPVHILVNIYLGNGKEYTQV